MAITKFVNTYLVVALVHFAFPDVTSMFFLLNDKLIGKLKVKVLFLAFYNRQNRQYSL
jgi:hypothetical protein